MTTLTVIESPDAVPAVPDRVGELLLLELPPTGDTTATPVGATVSTVNVATDDTVMLPAASVWVAVTV